MGFIRSDYSEVNAGFGALPIGFYECIISEAKLAKSKAGNDMIKLMLTIREDVEQTGKKRKFFDQIPLMDSMMWKVQQLMKAAQIDEGTEFETAVEFVEAIQYRAVCVKNKHEEYNGETNDKIALYVEPKVEGGSVAGQTIDVTDDDLPF